MVIRLNRRDFQRDAGMIMLEKPTIAEEDPAIGYPGGYCTVPAGTAAVPVLWVLQMGTAGYCGYCGYCTG